MRLAHTVKIALGLLSTTRDAAFARLGTVPLTQTLRFDNALATVDFTKAALVLGGIGSRILVARSGFVVAATFCGGGAAAALVVVVVF